MCFQIIALGVLRVQGMKRRPLGTSPRSRLTSRFEGIENVKNFDVEKWYNFNFLFAESFK
jgi:hypothetical protein